MAEGLEEGRAEGRAEGRFEGRSEGRSDMQRETALAMKLKGFSPQDISEVTGLADDEIDRL